MSENDGTRIGDGFPFEPVSVGTAIGDSGEIIVIVLPEGCDNIEDVIQMNAVEAQSIGESLLEQIASRKDGESHEYKVAGQILPMPHEWVGNFAVKLLIFGVSAQAENLLTAFLQTGGVAPEVEPLDLSGATALVEKYRRYLNRYYEYQLRDDFERDK